MTGGPETGRSAVTTMAALAVIETCVALLKYTMDIQYVRHLVVIFVIHSSLNYFVCFTEHICCQENLSNSVIV